MVDMVDDHELAGRGAHDSFASPTVPAAQAHPQPGHPGSTNLLTDNMSHEDYAWWFLALNYFLGPLPKFINKYPKKFSPAFKFVLDLTPGQVTFTDGQVAELHKVLNDIITKNLVKFTFRSN